MHSRKGVRRIAANLIWQRARGPGDARPTPRDLSRGSLGDPRDRDLTIPASGHAGERRSGFRPPVSCTHVPGGGVPRSCVAANLRGACLCGAAPLHMRASCSARMYCSGMSGRARRVRKGSGQDLHLVRERRPGFAAGACARSLPSTLDHTVIPGCTVTDACVSCIARTCPRSRHWPREPR